jgi:predicted nucleotidyltransferase
VKSSRTIKEIEHLLPRIRDLLTKVYGDRLVDIILYGSFAKNNATKESDIDIAVVLKGRVDKVKEIDRMGEVLYALMLETDELISVYPISEDELNNSIWPLYQHIKTEGLKI